MVEIIGLIFLGLWAAGKAKQKGRNQYLWSLTPIALYLTIYVLTYLILNFGVGITLSPTEKFSFTIITLIRMALIPLSFVLSRFLMEGLFRRMTDAGKSERQE
jgi:hypothetical protein